MRALSKMSLCCVGDHHSLLQSLGSLVLMQLSLLALELLQVSWLSLFFLCRWSLVFLQSLGTLLKVSWLFRWTRLVAVSWRSWWSLLAVSVNSSCCRLLVVLVKSLGCFGELVLFPSLGGLGEVSCLSRWTGLVAISWRSSWSLLSVSVNWSCCCVLAPSIVSVPTCECDVPALIPSRKDLHQIHKAYFTQVSVQTPQEISASSSATASP